MLSVFRVNVIMLSAVAPHRGLLYKTTNKFQLTSFHLYMLMTVYALQYMGNNKTAQLKVENSAQFFLKFVCNQIGYLLLM
jgi:hypothetical protein